MKVLYAINHRQIEDIITSKLGEEYEILEAVTYREALFKVLAEHRVDLLLLREGLSGDTPMPKIIEEIRLEYSSIRIIYICGSKKRGDMEIAQIVGLGVYDIICKDSIPNAEIVACIKKPKLFRDVAIFYLSDYIPEIEVYQAPVVEPQSKKKGFMETLFGGQKEQAPPPKFEEISDIPQADHELLKKSMKEEAIREAQRDMDNLLKVAVDKEIRQYTTEIENLNTQLTSYLEKINKKDEQITQLSRKIAEERYKYETKKTELDNHYDEVKKTYQTYEEQLSSLHDNKNTPEWYKEQSKKFSVREAQLIGEINRQKSLLLTMSEEKNLMDHDLKVLASSIVKLEKESGEKIGSYQDQLKLAKSHLENADGISTEPHVDHQLLSAANEKISYLQNELVTTKDKLKITEESLNQTKTLLNAESTDEQTEYLKKELSKLKQQIAESLKQPIQDESNLLLENELIKVQEELNQTKDSFRKEQLKVRTMEQSTNKQNVDNHVDKSCYSNIPLHLEETMKELKRENTAQKVTISNLEETLEKAKSETGPRILDGLDFSRPSMYIPIIPDESNYVRSSSPIRITVMVGAKHGIGNTTVALNLATLLASQGKKTLLMEFNNRFPMTNAFFELMNVPLGISDALGSIGTDPSVTDASIIRFHALSPANRGIGKVYKKLPAGLHLLTYPNKDLNSPHKSVPTREGLYSLLQYLLNKQQYSHIIIDIQPDEQYILDALITSDVGIDKLVLTTSQDPHGIDVVGKLNNGLLNKGMNSLLGESELVITKHNSGYLSAKKIANHLHFNQKHLSMFTDDTEGYINAASAGLPYYLTKGRYKGEYESLYAKIY